MKLLNCFLFLLIFCAFVETAHDKTTQSFLALKMKDSFEDDFGDFNMEEQLLKEKNKKQNKELTKITEMKKEKIVPKVDKIDIVVDKPKLKNQNGPKKTDCNVKSNSETNNLLNKLSPGFLQDLIKLQNNPMIQNLSSMMNKKSISSTSFNQQSETIKEKNVKIISKNDILDTSKLNYLENLISNVNKCDKSR
jgi:hypothetical protein